MAGGCVSRNLTTEGLPAAGPRCADCGVGSGPCQCTREFELWEAERELHEDEWAEWLDYIESLADRRDDALPDPLPRVRAEDGDE
jgi:hypothetical protein